MHCDKLRLRALAQGVQRLGDKLLARAALALDEHRGAGWSDLLNGFVNLLHHRRLPDQALQPVPLLHLLLELDHLRLDLPRAERALQQDFEPVDVDGFGDEIIRAAAHRLDCGVHRAVGRHHHHHRRLGAGEYSVDELHAVLAPKPQIGEHQVDGFPLQNAQRAGDIAGHVNIKGVLQGGPQAFARMLLIINDQ